ncbi:MAG: hypothetical protein QOH15_1379 [Gaiellales bacterium]|nr:hypothetical protein [Gaiellales bacterium]
MSGVTADGVHDAEVESRWEAAPAVLFVIALQAMLAAVSYRAGWHLWNLPWWAWLGVVVPETVLLIPLAWSRPRHQLEEIGKRRMFALLLFAVVSLGNAGALIALIGSLVMGHEDNGVELIYKGITIWTTNVIAFGLWYWVFDRGGPVRRREENAPPPDFQFPQMENPGLAEPGWHPRLFDYIYISFTNSIAFSPTDAMPLTRTAKVLMLIQSAASALTVLLVAARGVNILQ